jgi:hypothetical protein
MMKITTASHTLFVLALFSLSVHAAPLTGVAGSSDSTLVMGGAVSGLNFLGGQEGFGPLDPTPLPAGLTADELIAKMGARESEFAKARTNYVFRQTVKVQTITEDTNKVDGEYQQVTDISISPTTGRREEHVVFAPQNTLERVMMSPADFKDIEQRLPFVLTTEELPQYNITYLGRQKVDELDTYVLDVKPKVMEKNKRYYQGKVWIDQQDFQIVLINGKNVPDDTRAGHEDLSPPFTTYYEQIDGKYWFPTYTKMEGTLHFAAQRGAVSQDVHMRNIIRYTDYKRFRGSARIISTGDVQSDAPATTTPPKK